MHIWEKRMTGIDFELLMKHIPGALVIDMEGKVLYLNQQ